MSRHLMRKSIAKPGTLNSLKKGFRKGFWFSFVHLSCITFQDNKPLGENICTFLRYSKVEISKPTLSMINTICDMLLNKIMAKFDEKQITGLMMESFLFDNPPIRPA